MWKKCTCTIAAVHLMLHGSVHDVIIMTCLQPLYYIALFSSLLHTVFLFLCPFLSLVPFAILSLFSLICKIPMFPMKPHILYLVIQSYSTNYTGMLTERSHDHHMTYSHMMSHVILQVYSDYGLHTDSVKLIRPPPRQPGIQS